MLTKQFGDVLPTFSYARENRETTMLKLRFVITALTALFAGWFIGAISRPAPLVATPSLAVVDLSTCWHPGASRNIGIAEMPCP
jgi:hypothetical protein